MGKEGAPINNFDPKAAIKRNAENARDWEFSEEAGYLYDMAEIFRDRLFAKLLPSGEGQLPDPIISFDDLRNKKTLATYTLHRNPQGLLDEITFNKVHYQDGGGRKIWKWGKWAQLETLAHEQVHLWQQNFGKHPVNPEKVTHNKEFVDICERLGLHPLPVVGSHYAVADGPFAQLMGELGIPRPDDVPRIEGKARKRDWFRLTPERGKSTLHKWVCPDCGLNVRIGIGSDPQLVHDVCSEIRGEKVFLVRHDELKHTIYDAADEENPQKTTPSIIAEINEYLMENSSKDIDFTVEGIAKRAGINKNILYEWVEGDSEFTTALERLKEVQKNDPFKTGTDEDTHVNAMMIALLLLEKKDRHYR